MVWQLRRLDYHGACLCERHLYERAPWLSSLRSMTSSCQTIVERREVVRFNFLKPGVMQSAWWAVPVPSQRGYTDIPNGLTMVHGEIGTCNVAKTSGIDDVCEWWLVVHRRTSSPLFSPLGKVAGRAIYFTDVFLYFFIFFNFFFNGRLSSHRSWDTNRAIFTKISGLVDNWKGLITPLSFFLIFQGTLPWQRVKVEKSTFFPDQSTLSHCHSETDCNIAIPISRCSPQWISLHRVQFLWHSVQKPQSSRR